MPNLFAPQLQEQTTLDMLLAQLLVLSRRSTMADTCDTTRSTTFQIYLHIWSCVFSLIDQLILLNYFINGWVLACKKTLKMRTSARRDSSSFNCGVLSDFCAAVGRLHDAGLSAKRGASSSNCTAGCGGNWWDQKTGDCLPRWSMYGIFTYIYPINDPNVGKYTIHGSSGLLMFIVNPSISGRFCLEGSWFSRMHIRRS